MQIPFWKSPDTRKNLACKILRLGWAAIATPSLPTQCDPPEGFYVIEKRSSLLHKKPPQAYSLRR
jgi:hypothetical protein